MSDANQRPGSRGLAVARWGAPTSCHRGARALTVLLLALATGSAGGAGCGAGTSSTVSEVRTEEIELTSDRAYLRLPREVFDAEIQAEAGEALLQCYEQESTIGTWQATHVEVQFVLVGERPSWRVAQRPADFSDSFAGCIEQVTVNWELHPGVMGEGEIIPLDFGPAQ